MGRKRKLPAAGAPPPAASRKRRRHDDSHQPPPPGQYRKKKKKKKKKGERKKEKKKERKKRKKEIPTASPTSGQEHLYGQKRYWQQRYEDGAEQFEWHLPQAALRGLLEQHCAALQRGQAVVVDLGCGTSRFLADLAAEPGFSGKLIGIDYAPSALAWQRTQPEAARLELHCAPARDISRLAGVGAVDLVLDKATMDGNLAGQRLDVVAEYAAAVGQALAPGGLYAVTSHMNSEEFVAEPWVAAVTEALQRGAGPGARFELDAHFHDQDTPGVWLFSKHARPTTRQRDRPATLAIRLHQHDDE